jgi:hypothetical protein
VGKKLSIAFYSAMFRSIVKEWGGGEHLKIVVFPHSPPHVSSPAKSSSSPVLSSVQLSFFIIYIFISHYSTSSSKSYLLFVSLVSLLVFYKS